MGKAPSPGLKTVVEGFCALFASSHPILWAVEA